MLQGVTRVRSGLWSKINARRVIRDDLPVCRLVLCKLHSLSIAYGSPHRLHDTDPLITDDDGGTGALLQNFANSFPTNDERILDAEMDRLEGILPTVALERPGSPAKSLGLELSEEIRAISLRDEGLRPLVWEQAVQEGKIIIIQEEHQ
jgi:hypothetical protein